MSEVFGGHKRAQGDAEEAEGAVSWEQKLGRFWGWSFGEVSSISCQHSDWRVRLGRNRKLMNLIEFDPSLLVLTNKVTDEGILWPEYDYVLVNGGDLVPIVVSQVRRNLQPAYIVFDGNHRACLWAKHGRKARAYVMMRDTTSDEILEMEGANKIHRFPHREFLADEETFTRLMTRAIKAALEVNETVAQVVERIRKALPP